MAKQHQSDFVSSMRDRLAAAHEQHKDAETKYGFMGELPPGIDGGVAMLTEMKFDKYKSGPNEGEWYFYAGGRVDTPKEFNGIRTEGQLTSITEPLYDTPGRTRETVEDHMGFVYNVLRQLGQETSTLEFEDLEQVCEDLKNADPPIYFRFRTYKMDKEVVAQSDDGKWRIWSEDAKTGNLKPSRNPGAWPTEEAAMEANPFAGREPKTLHSWHGWVKDYTPQEVNDTVDNTGNGRVAPPATQGRQYQGMHPVAKSSAKPTVGAPQKATAASAQKPTAGKPMAATEKPAAPASKPMARPTAPTAKPTAAPAKMTAKAPPTKAPTPAKPAVRPAPTPAGKKPMARPAPEPEPFDEFGDLDGLVERCNRMDGEAQAELTNLAINAGYTEADVLNSESWEQVKGWIMGGEPPAEEVEDQTDEAPAEEGGEDEFMPEEDQVWYYKPINARSKKPGKRTEVKVIGVQPSTRTVTVQDLATEQEYRNVPWDDLLGDDSE